jgi:hypothetical protein
MLGSSCSPCCSQPCACGDTTKTYAQQTDAAVSAGRWCCGGIKPSEVTVRTTAYGVANSFVSYQQVGSYFYTSSGGYFEKRFKRTITIDTSSINADYVLHNTIFPTQLSYVRQCAYGFGSVNYPRIYAGSGSAENPRESQTYPSYTLTFMTGNSSVVGMNATTGTIRREYEYRNLVFSNHVFSPTGDWTRDALLDTESTSLSISYNWAASYNIVLNDQACDIRPLGISWSSDITPNFLTLPDGSTDSIGVLGPLFSLSVQVLPT